VGTQPWPTSLGTIGQPLPAFNPGSAAAPSEPVPDSFSFAKPRDPRWYQHAVFYEVLVRGFHDSNGDGTGDIRGLTSRLDYLQWLGIDCIWLLPIYDSPLRDGGYDITSRLRQYRGFRRACRAGP
jgi:maltose alpha-D-glucosyltransferase / alpha-amylase